MLNKKGEEDLTIKNLLSTVLAIAAIITIVIWLWWVITDITKDTELEAAQSVINRIEARVNTLEAGQSLNLTIQGFNQKEISWYFLGWGENQAGRPDKCFDDSCICICSGTTAEACQNRGICRFFQVEEIEVKEYRQMVKTPANSDYDPYSTSSPTFEKGSTAYIRLPENLLVLEINKLENKVAVHHYTKDYLEDTS